MKILLYSNKLIFKKNMRKKVGFWPELQIFNKYIELDILTNRKENEMEIPKEYGMEYNLYLYFPSVYEDAKTISKMNAFELFIETNAGDCYVYNELHNRIRMLPKDKLNMTDEEIKREFMLRLRSCIERKGYNQIDISEMTGIAQCVLSRYMNGTSLPSFQNLDKIAKALDCSIDEFRYA